MALIGPNGAGKTTFLNIVAGREKADDGIVSPKKGLKIGYLPQSCEFDDLSPEQILVDAQADPEMPDYEKIRHAETWLSKLGFPPNVTSAKKLSGGWKKRLGLARELINSPDLLLLDEPTNHLDLEGIFWLEKFLAREAPSYLLVSHDRYFLQNTTNRIVEIDPTYPKGMLAIDGSYSFFLEKKGEFLEGQIQQERSLATKARRETEWLRAGVKARTTKAQSRIDEAEEILQAHADVKRRNIQKRTAIDFAASERETRKLLVAKNISKQLGDKNLFERLEFTLSPGTRIGLMGPNGSGKTSLLKLLAGEMEPDQGTIKRADALKIVYFDQHRAKLPLNISLREALSPNGDFVTFRGKPVHINGWCKRFLFSPDLLDIAIGKLSGGERARISIAHLMLQPADLLLLDEPTNDLDIPTLEILEESLLEFPGAVVLITHDRCMLDRISNSLLAMGDPNNTQFYADYPQWEASLKAAAQEQKQKEKKVETAPRAIVKLTYNEKREYEQMEATIAVLEEEVKKINELLMDASIAQNPGKLEELCSTIALKENKIEQLYLRWEELEKKQKP